jgi:hypothetical protein
MRKYLEIFKINRALELGMTDLISLEPIDPSYRPYRLNEIFYSVQRWEELIGISQKDKK